MFDRLIVYAVIAAAVAAGIGGYGEHRYYAGVAHERKQWTDKIDAANRENKKLADDATAAKEIAEAGRVLIASDILSRPMASLSPDMANQCSYPSDIREALNRIAK